MCIQLTYTLLFLPSTGVANTISPLGQASGLLLELNSCHLQERNTVGTCNTIYTATEKEIHK